MQLVNPWLAFAFGAVLAFGVQQYRMNAELTKVELDHTQEQKDAVDRALQQQQGADAKRVEGEAKQDGQTVANNEELQRVQNENDRLNRCLRLGTCGLRVAAACPKLPSTAASGTPAGNIGTGARLDAAAEQDYLEFRRKYAEQLAKLRSCRVFGQLHTQPVP